MKYVSLIKLSDEGRKSFPHADKLFLKTVEITEKLGGKVLETYALASRYDFVAIAEYPTPELGFEAHLKMTELGIFETIESFEAYDMEFFLAKV